MKDTINNESERIMNNIEAYIKAGMPPFRVKSITRGRGLEKCCGGSGRMIVKIIETQTQKESIITFDGIKLENDETKEIRDYALISQVFKNYLQYQIRRYIDFLGYEQHNAKNLLSSLKNTEQNTKKNR